MSLSFIINSFIPSGREDRSIYSRRLFSLSPNPMEVRNVKSLILNKSFTIFCLGCIRADIVSLFEVYNIDYSICLLNVVLFKLTKD